MWRMAGRRRWQGPRWPTWTCLIRQNIK
jgi:hypothetical protein